MNHFTDRTGYNAIRSQPAWTFKAGKPRAKHHPVGAYFTTYLPSEPKLAVKIFVPVKKLEFIFAFADAGNLLPLPEGRGRNGRIFYSPLDYPVGKTRQRFGGESSQFVVDEESSERDNQGSA